MDFITYTGRAFNLAAITPEDIDIRDIAWSLSMTTRFNGHVRQPYTVAQHSMLAMRYVPAHLRLTALLHDAAEAYIGDISRPMRLLLPELNSIEERVQWAISQAFGVPEETPALVDIVDTSLLKSEAQEFLGVPLPGLGSYHAIEIGAVLNQEEAYHGFLSDFDWAMEAHHQQGAV